MIYVLNHHSRNCSDTVRAIRDDAGEEPVVSTDRSDWNKTRGHTRWLGVATNYCNVLRHPDAGRWKIVLHDDVTIPPGLFARIRYVLDHAPDNIVSFYNPTNAGYLRAAASGRHHVLRTYANWWTQCHAFPTSMADRFLRWVDTHVERFGRFAEDGMLWRFCSRERIPVYAVVPSFIQHEGFDKSTFGISGRVGKYTRNSATYDPGFDVSAIDWGREFADPFPEDTKKMGKEGLRNVA